MASKFANNDTLSVQKRLNALRYNAKKKYGLNLKAVQALRMEPCEICHVKAKKMTIDHVVPRTYRGVLCQQCNVRVGWFERWKHQIEAYCAYSVAYSMQRRASR